MTGTMVKTKRLRRAILEQEQYLNSSEISMAKSILKWLPYHKKWIDSLKYFDHLRERHLKSHKVQARFAITIFELVGAVYE